MDSVVVVIVLLLLGGGFYFIPSFVGAARKHPLIGGIVATNILLGWTVIGWIGALIWAFSSSSKNNNNAQSAPAPSNAVKRCPACAEEILAAARKCKHCGETLAAPLAP